MKILKCISAKTVFPLIMLALEGYWYNLTFSVPVSATDTTTIFTSVSYPRFVLTVMLACTLAVFVWELSCAMKTEEKEQTDHAQRMDIVKVIILIAAIFAYSMVMSTIGFIISTILLMLVTGILYGQRNKILLIATSVLFPVALYIVFRYSLKILLPTLFL